MLTIDGSQGEGGGQILRSSLSLAVATGQAVRLENVRAGRPKPGLLRQHLTALRAAGEICGAKVSGDSIGSECIEFHPGPVRAGDYGFAVGTAGSAMLVLQTVLVPLCLTNAPSTLRIEGGTHNPWAPPFEFFAESFLPSLRHMGARVDVELVRAGFHPAGGGEVRVRIEPATEMIPFELLDRGAWRGGTAEILFAHLSGRIALTEKEVLAQALNWSDEQVQLRQVTTSAGPGNMICVRLAFDAVCEIVSGFGRKGVPARRVAQETAKEAQRYLSGTAPIGPHLADQLLVPMALFRGGQFRTFEPTPHTLTNLKVLEAFLGKTAQLEAASADSWIVRVEN